MAFHHTSGTEVSLADWFATFEAWITGTVGWSVSSGSGTTNLVITSPGELGNRTKLFANLRVPISPDGYLIYGEVQDDAAGVHKTTSNAYLYAYVNEDTPQLFDYWISADLDAIVIVFRRSSDAYYTSIYLGLVIPIARTLGGEEYMMIAARPNQAITILRNYDGTWDANISYNATYSSGITDPTELDNFVYITGITAGGTNDVAGQLKHCTGVIYIDEIDVKDTIETGPAGAKTTWIVLGYTSTASRFAIRTGGVNSVGVDNEVGFKHSSGIITSVAAWFALLEDWLVNTVGWTLESGSGSYDLVFSSIGENGTEAIFIRVYWNTVSVSVHAYSDAVGTQTTPTTSFAMRPYHFPTQYYMSADKDCLCFTLNITGDYSLNWVGKFKQINPNLPDTPRKVGVYVYSGTITIQSYVLRRHNIAGTSPWTLQRRYGMGSSIITPNLFDLNTHVMWPTLFYSLSAYGTPKYVYRVDGSISLMDTIQSGNRVYRVFRQINTTYPYWCMRVQ